MIASCIQDRRRTLSAFLVLVSLCAAAAIWTSGAEAKPKQGDPPVPVVFVHGNSGSAQQFETNAMRFTSNGYPHNRLYAYEYDTSGSSNDAAIANLDGFIADVKDKTGASTVDILAHSRGTTVMHAYLSTPARAEQVRRYVNFDGRTSATPPGGVPTLAIWGEGDHTREIGGATNAYFPDKAHTDVTTSREAFAKVYEFLTGKEPEAADVVPEPPGQVTVAGRAAQFPANVGYEGAVMRMYEVRAETGARKPDGPVHAVTLGADGSFGPFKLNGTKHYEFAVSKDGESTIHNYPEPFERDDHFYRVLAAPGLAPFIETGPDHTALTVTRMREWWGNQADAAFNDKLEINGLNVINPAIAPRARRVLAVFNFDKGSDGVTDTSAALFPFNVLSFLTGVDDYLPASPDHSGTIAVKETMRGTGHEETINVPNWPSDQHTVSAYFRDYVAETFPSHGG
ncbi:MAG TPA: alpha/beta hydrolase [Solirubrobacteraceae bacterium]|nr:alpha/beta hydrolase [Solirubrobacteraceae bacterium]